MLTEHAAGPDVGALDHPVRVLQSFPRRGPATNPYLLQLVDSLGTAAPVSYFSWGTALGGRYDVLHVHWPERLTRGSSPARTFARRLALAALLARISLRRIAVVRTLHNVASHEQGGWWEERLLGALDRRTTLWIRLNPFTPVPDGALSRTILHGHYRDWFPAGDPQPKPGRVLFFGLVRPYKGVEELVAAFRELRDPDATLRLVGKPQTAELRAELDAAIEADPRVSAEWAYVDDATLAEELRSAQLVVLPYRALHNSGAALLALSLDRPVLLPAGEMASWLADAVGPGWVGTFTPPLTADQLSAALDAAAPAATRPDLSDRDWEGIGAQHVECYRAAVAARRRRPAAGVTTGSTRKNVPADR